VYCLIGKLLMASIYISSLKYTRGLLHLAVACPKQQKAILASIDV
jgi:hypothetical protein